MANNLNQIFNVDFSNTNDEFNWINNTSNPIQTISGELVLKPESVSSEFRRGLGSIDPTNNRVRVQSNIKMVRPQSSNSSVFCAIFGLYVGSLLVGQYSVYADDLSTGDVIEYNFDREYKYENISGNLSLKISFPQGFENELNLEYLTVTDYTFCEDNLRTYFIIDSFLDDAKDSQSSAFQLTAIEIDDVETLTQSFFNDNANPGGNPSSQWNFALADLDCRNRVQENTSPNSFNPFVSELGLDFDNVNSFFGGKPIAVTNGNDYGPGIMTLGFQKPEILNGSLVSKKGAFFIDLDYTKNFKMIFNVVVNNSSSSVFNNPSKYREYTIEWDVNKCERKFFYKDILNNDNIVDVLEDGFLSGLTGKVNNQQIIACDESFSFTGQSGVTELEIDFGTDIGQAGIAYNAFGVPDKFDIEWNGQLFSSGYVGVNTSDQQLLNLGIPPSEINTANPSNGSGQLLFDKTQATPTKAKIIVTAPLSGTAWEVSGICPQVVTPPQSNFVKLTDSPTINTDDTDGNGVRTLVVGNDVEFGVDLTGDDEINVTYDYELKQKGDAISSLYYIKNGQEFLLARVTPSTASQITGTHTINIAAGDTVTIKKELIYTPAPTTPNGGLIKTTRNNVQLINGNYDPFNMLNWGPILVVGFSLN